MAKDQMTTMNCNRNAAAAGGGIYGLAFVGVFVYYVVHAADFWQGAVGLLKALVWPAIVAYNVFDLLHM